MTIDMSQFFQAFFDETDELLGEMEKLLLAIDVAAPDAEDLNAIFRAAHSIKGGAATFGLSDLTEVTHVLETLLDRIRKGEMALLPEHVDAFLSAKDVLKMQLDGHRLHTEVDEQAVAEVRRTLDALAKAMPGVQAAASTAPQTVVVDAAVFEQPAVAAGTKRFRIELPEVSARDVEALAAELGLLGQITKSALDDKRFVFQLDTSESADDIVAICSFILDPDDLKISEEAPPQAGAQSLEDAQGYGFFEPLPNRIEPDSAAASAQEMPAAPLPAEHAAKTVPDDSAKKAAAKREADKPAAANSESSSIRVGVEKVDQLINLVGELVITQAMIEQRAGTLDPILHERLLNSVGQLARNTRALQESVMSIRMMPMDYVFSRFPRMVRDLAGKLGKKVEFITHGAATELDKGLIERIVDPLTHLVRNSVDHGIEKPEVRKAAGKQEAGRLSLSAEHRGGHIVIEVSDDGGGLNRERILNKARQQGLEVSDNMPDGEVWQLIFAPGFSTAEVVTDVSGRGVGMDVVKRNIAGMGGSVEIRSAKGHGTTISVSLPLTLAILDGMSVKVGDEIYILPLGYVVESLQPAESDVKEISGSGRVVKVRGEYLPLVPLYRVFDVTPVCPGPAQGILVIVESDGKKAALLIDELVGQQQVVVKNLESNYRKVANVSGATILGDGGVALIVDVSALLRSAAAGEALAA
jgi:two-component system chemotaxis sensor kinase CheA